MSGKPYQQREMKSIVDYLVEHRFYNETKGRKMWMDYADTKLTTRTWQSLKETFLKRILPDITNPYYRLDPDQILSFKRGLDLTQKDKKLEFKPVNDSVNNGTNGDNQQPSTSKHNNEEHATGEDSQCSKIVHDRASTETLVLDTYHTAEDIERELENTDEESDKDKAKTKTKPVKSVRDFIEYSENNLYSFSAGTNGDNQQPSTSKHNNEEHATGEDSQCSKIVHDRASTETLVLDTYHTAEDIERELENTDEESDKDKAKTKTKPVKSVRDFIEYSEPLTPMLQEVLDDFATDEDGSDSERPMQIDENYIAQEQIVETSEIAASQSILQPKPKDTPAEQAKIEGKKNMDKTEKEKQVIVIEHNEESVKPTDDTVFTQLDDVMVLMDEVLAKDLDKELNTEKVESLNMEGNSCHSSSALTDSLLPNNQEAVQKSASTVAQSPTLSTPNADGHQENKEKMAELDVDSQNSKTHLISDEEQDKVQSKNTNTIGCNEGRVNDKDSRKKPNMTLIKHTTNITSPKSLKKLLGDGEIHEAHSDSSASNKNENVKIDNPCLQSVSLYAEQLTATKYSDSETNNTETAKEPPKASENNVEKNDEAVKHKRKASKENGSEDQRNKEAKPVDNVILLHSHTTSESVDDSLTNHRPLARSSLKKQKDKKLASVFGFSNGGAAKSRRLGSRKRTISHRNLPSDSSDWTSASDSEFVSPPHGRRNRYARKYLKPHSARIMSLDEEGGLFVMLGRKVYPLVKDGKSMKNFVTYLPESDPEEDDSYWKSKYIEQRKQTAELKKKLGQTNGALDKTEKESSISLSSPILEIPPRVRISRQESLNGTEIMRRDSGATEKTKQETLKIKFTKKGQEVQLEGHWQDINPVLEQVVSMFHKDAEVKKADAVTCVELSSGETTPIVAPNAAPRDKGLHEKINEIESAIFKQIEEQDVDESGEQNKDLNNVMETNGRDNIPVEKDREINITVTEGQEIVPSEYAVEENIEEQPRITLRKKRGRPKKETSPALAVAQSPAKRPRKSSTKAKEVKAQESADNTPNLTRQTRTPRKLLDGVPTKAKTTRKSTAKAQLLEPVEPVEVQETPAEDPEDEVRYKFPSPVPESIDINSNDPSKEHLPNITSPDSLSRHSVNSSQGYQDSDTSPFNIGKRRKRRLSIPTSFKGRKAQRALRRNSYPLLKQIDSESSNPSFVISMKTIRREQSTLNSEVYRSDSYQFLMPRTRSIVRTLEKIDEVTSNENNTLMDQIRDLRNDMLRASDPTNKNDAASSSSLSLPLSPELSIVENLSISRSALAAIDDPTLNEIQANDMLKTCNNKYLISAVDVSMPLMAQDCALREGYKKHIMSALSNLSDTPNSAGRNLSYDSNMRVSMTTESILKNVSVVNIANSDSLDRRLEQLLLESAQKPVNDNGGEKMEVDTVIKKKSGSRKRCSTPHKRKTVPNKKKIVGEPIIEEESKAHCARSGRRSCPPSVNIVYYEDNAPDNLEINIHDRTIDVTTVTKSKRVKKDVIKVKIVRPKAKPQKKSKSKTKTPDVSQTSVNTEGDNESGVFLQGLEDSSDLIHNHSETCLQIGECMGDSVEFIETTTKSIISLSSSSLSADDKENVDGNSTDSEKMEPEVFCDNAQCAMHLRDAQVTGPRSTGSGNTVYFTPFVTRCNSVVTEDLSDEAPTKRTNRDSKWYLLSDEESNTNYFDVQENDYPSYGANLQKLFPITCAVPDLSTITEMSGNESTQKASLDDARRS